MLNKDFKQFAGFPYSSGAEYLLVSYAIAAYGHPRYSGDLDIRIGSNSANATRVMAAPEQFGFDSLTITQRDLKTPGRAAGRLQDLANLETLRQSNPSGD